MNKLPGALGKVGRLFQLAYMAENFGGTLARWNAIGVGPFYALRGLSLKNIEFRGQMTELDIDIAFAYWGDIQIEIIRQNNDQPSIYLDWQKQRKQEIHHLGVMVDDMAAARAHLEGNGYQFVYHKLLEGHGEFTYVQSPDAPVLFELITHEPGEAAGFVRLHAEAANWDGSRPVRDFTELLGA